MKKYYFVFVLIILGALGLVYFFRAGWHPVALVNKEVVWSWEVQREHQTAIRYYNQAAKTYNLPEIAAQDNNDLKKAALGSVIDKKIIANGLNLLVGEQKDALVAAKINKYLESPGLKSAAETLFNLTFEEFVDIILVPQAEKEIVSEKLETENRKFSSWLETQRKQASVYLLTKEFNWNGVSIERN